MSEAAGGHWWPGVHSRNKHQASWLPNLDEKNLQSPKFALGRTHHASGPVCNADPQSKVYSKVSVPSLQEPAFLGHSQASRKTHHPPRTIDYGSHWPSARKLASTQTSLGRTTLKNMVSLSGKMFWQQTDGTEEPMTSADRSPGDHNSPNYRP